MTCCQVATLSSRHGLPDDCAALVAGDKDALTQTVGVGSTRSGTSLPGPKSCSLFRRGLGSAGYSDRERRRETTGKLTRIPRSSRLTSAYLTARLTQDFRVWAATR